MVDMRREIESMNIEELLDFIKKVGTVAKTIKKGESTQVPCNCGGTLTVRKSSFNGVERR